ncbi:hypothetical protein RRG08_024842 [Elysia crispata]|uniref:Uncharacterized protein n=1 Tax=Elysia crispata TaxID=231223 RepID=A0AAE1D096_9GAST|nr:hypothetical protein RRG08_024842 [Elysia crispata]
MTCLATSHHEPDLETLKSLTILVGLGDTNSDDTLWLLTLFVCPEVNAFVNACLEPSKTTLRGVFEPLPQVLT